MSLKELIVLFLVIALLYRLGLWSIIVRGLRELRGEPVDDTRAASASSHDTLDICYKILGLSPSAAWEDIEKAYRGKARIHHPDHGGDGDAMRALNDAYAHIKRARGR